MKIENRYLEELLTYATGLKLKEIKPSTRLKNIGNAIAHKGSVSAIHLRKYVGNQHLLEVVINYNRANPDSTKASYRIQLTPFIKRKGFAIDIKQGEVTRLGLLYNEGVIPNKKVDFPEADLLHFTGAEENLNRFMEYTIKNIKETDSALPKDMGGASGTF